MFVKKKMITTVVAQIMIVRIALLYVRYNGHGGNISLRLEFWLMRSFEVPSFNNYHIRLPTSLR